MKHGGLEFRKFGDGSVNVVVYDGIADNAPVTREVIFSDEKLGELKALLTPPKVARKSTRKTKRKK